MSTRQRHESQSLPLANYSSAIAKAVEWLGDRYLLAKPINATPIRDTPAAAPMAAHSSLTGLATTGRP
jgi:hypothetical protein